MSLLSYSILFNASPHTKQVTAGLFTPQFTFTKCFILDIQIFHLLHNYGWTFTLIWTRLTHSSSKLVENLVSPIDSRSNNTNTSYCLQLITISYYRCLSVKVCLCIFRLHKLFWIQLYNSMNRTRGTKQSLTSMTRKKTSTDRRCGSCHVKQAFAYFKGCAVWLFQQWPQIKHLWTAAGPETPRFINAQKKRTR